MKLKGRDILPPWRCSREGCWFKPTYFSMASTKHHHSLLPVSSIPALFCPYQFVFWI